MSRLHTQRQSRCSPEASRSAGGLVIILILPASLPIPDRTHLASGADARIWPAGLVDRSVMDFGHVSNNVLTSDASPDRGVTISVSHSCDLRLTTPALLQQPSISKAEYEFRTAKAWGGGQGRGMTFVVNPKGIVRPVLGER